MKAELIPVKVDVPPPTVVLTMPYSEAQDLLDSLRSKPCINYRNDVAYKVCHELWKAGVKNGAEVYTKEDSR